MKAGLLLAVLLCAASVGAAQEASVAPKVDCDTCQARHRGLQSLQAALQAGRKQPKRAAIFGAGAVLAAVIVIAAAPASV